ncbi:MAG: ester cyclase [Anaeromyxobacteraceae bacterium]
MTDVERNRALVRRFVEIVNGEDLSDLDEVAASGFAEGMRRWIGPFRKSFPDFRMEVVDVIAEPDKVVGHFKCSGTNEGEWQGKPPTGRRFEDIDEIYIFAVEDGKLAGSLAALEDNVKRMRQLGQLE